MEENKQTNKKKLLMTTSQHLTSLLVTPQLLDTCYIRTSGCITKVINELN